MEWGVCCSPVLLPLYPRWMIAQSQSGGTAVWCHGCWVGTWAPAGLCTPVDMCCACELARKKVVINATQRQVYACALVHCSELYLARHVAKADSGTCGPQTGSSPLHLVFAFWSKALSHSSRPRASLPEENTKISINIKLMLLYNTLKCNSK